MDYFFSVLIIILFIGLLLFVRSFEANFSKNRKLYIKKNKIKFCDELCFTRWPDSIVYKNFMGIRNCVKVSSGLYWAEFNISFAEYVFRYDVVYIESVKKLQARMMHKKIKLKSKPDVIDNNKTIENFLLGNGLSVDAGHWGVFVFKNKGSFTIDQVKEVNEFFQKLK